MQAFHKYSQAHQDSLVHECCDCMMPAKPSRWHTIKDALKKQLHKNEHYNMEIKEKN